MMYPSRLKNLRLRGRASSVSNPPRTAATAMEASTAQAQSSRYRKDTASGRTSSPASASRTLPAIWKMMR